MSNNYQVHLINKNITRLKFIRHNNQSNQKIIRSRYYSNKKKVYIPVLGDDQYKFKYVFDSFNIQSIPMSYNNLFGIVKLGKDYIDKWINLGMVYKFNCKKCSQSYIGESKRS